MRRGRKFARANGTGGAAEISAALPVLHLSEFLHRQAEEPAFKMQEGLVPDLHDRAVENIPYGEQKLF